MSALEFSRTLRVERITPGLVHEIAATDAECAALAARMGIEAILSLSCAFTFTPEAGGVIAATAELRARIRQICVVTLEPFDADLADSADVRFVPEDMEGLEDDPEAPDEIPYAGAVLELGEAAAEQLALALEPYPRSPGAVLPEVSDAPAHPFAALRRLKGE